MAEFNCAADATIDRVRAIYAQRGEEYADSWALANVSAPFVRATLRDAFGVEDADPEALRLLLVAALVDVKDSRMIGPWKRDSVDDGIAYRAAFCTMREEFEQRRRGTADTTSSS